MTKDEIPEVSKIHPLKNRLPKEPQKDYTVAGNPACSTAKKGVEPPVIASQRHTVSATIQEDKGMLVIRARVYDPKTGKRRQRSKSTGIRADGKNKRRAEQIRKEVESQWEKEANAGIVTSDTTVEECVRAWLEIKKHQVKRNTWLGYKDYADNYIIPSLGGFRMQELALWQVQQFYNDLLKHIGTNTAKKIHVVVRGAMRYAVQNGVLQHSFADYVEFPRKQRFEGKAYSPEQVAVLLQTAAEIGEPIFCAVILAVGYGLRREEICGLRWKEIDFENRCLSICSTTTLYRNEWIESDDTKTEHSRRMISLLDSTVPYLLRLRKTQEEAGLTLDRVCVWPDGRRVRPDYISSKFNKILKKAGLPHIRFHDLRHTASSLLAPSVSPIQLKDFMGHEDISTTMNIYTHIMDEGKRQTANAMDTIIAKLLPCSASVRSLQVLEGGKESEEPPAAS